MNLKNHLTYVYGIYAASAVLQFFETTLVLGLLFLVVAYILNISKKEKLAAVGTPFESHLHWARRTFWLGTGVIVPAAMVVAFILILNFTDVSGLRAAMNNSDPDIMMQGVQGYMGKGMDKASSITTIAMIPTAIWWVWRCWTGYVLAKAGKPVENVKSWSWRASAEPSESP